ncbi:type IV secretion system DNA-binding domain-containing protein [Candidatus Bathycorpusculum sp.]|uniref:type IV secretory system conjugative DNA transfer family protein n=1 Tax=Candidatus Bathycorpusculum sp. TaxID=2994959 RepID=UPI0028274ABC|nr:type IV secretory system conjugative DNA transfer family protein [Candidatus Termitimicrobium sp.]
MSNPNSNPKTSKPRLHVLGVDAETDPVIGKKLKRGIYASDRIHSLIMGFPGSGKTRFLLSMIKQHIDNNEGFMVIDSHSDLTQLVLTHIPPEKWDQVIYINPWSAFEDKYGNRVLQINFLEHHDPYERDVVARMFMDTLEKLYERWWGPRLDMILLNALYLLMEKEHAKLPDLYMILSDQDFRDMLTTKCRDRNVKVFWEKQYDKMPKDASVAVLTKLYRLVQERIIVPMFMAEKSGIDFRRVMDERKIVIVDLPEGKVTTDIANFLGSLILSAVYNAGMSREDTPEVERQPFFVYVDEAYRYTTKSIPEVLQSLRKFKVFMTLASQYLTQYRRDIQDAIVQTCETIVSFRVGEDTARVLEKFYPKTYGYQTLMNLPRYLFFVSTPFKGNREYQVLETLDYKTGPTNTEDVIRYSLKKYGQQVDVDELMGQVKNQSVQSAFLDWAVTPAEWAILLTIRLNGGSIDEETLQKHLLYDPTKPKPYVLSDMGFANALKNLAVDNNKRDAWLSSKTETVRQLREEAFAYGRKELKAKEVRTRFWCLDLTDRRAKRLLDTVFRGEKAGGVDHILAIMAQRKIYWQNGWIVRIDDGETDASLADLYVTPTLPASRVDGAKGYIDHTNWDYPRSFAVEVECYPSKHWDRLENNYKRNKKMGFPTVFLVPTKTDAETLTEKLCEWKATLVANSARFEPNHPEQATIEIINILNNPTNETTNSNQLPPYGIEQQQIEQTPSELSCQEPSTQLDLETKAASFEIKPVAQPVDKEQTVAVEVDLLRRKCLVLELALQGWSFRLKEVNGKGYLCARKGHNDERSLGVFRAEIKQLIEENRITVKGFNTNSTAEEEKK